MKKNKPFASFLRTTSIFAILALISGATIACNPENDNKGPAVESTPATADHAPAVPEFQTPKTPKIDLPDASKKEIPSNDVAQQMAKNILLEFNRAIQKDDFYEFYQMISDTWKKQITPEAFREAYSEFVQKSVDISNISPKDAVFSKKPGIGKVKGFDTLMIYGEYDTRPAKTEFELDFIQQGKDWKLSKIRLKLGPE